MVYVLTCDDPGLSKAPFLASKNVHFPDRREIEALEYYLEHFVWGGLQRTDAEKPYPYGVYGTPEWYTNRSPERRAAYTDRDLDREHVWRSYDYPHVIMLYFHMYEIAKLYPELSTYLDATGYLRRAFGTARAFYTYPYEIYPDYYETYKWGLYNELIVLKLIAALEEEGLENQAEYLRSEWERKVKYFVYDDEYPLRSEYAFDRTAFESSYALAKYGATHDMAPDRHLWWDVQKEKWYSHPLVRREDARAFMDRQLLGNLAVRGWLETSYYQLGADPSLSYMAAMGGWGVLDYGIHFAPEPWDWLQLGYASYLSSWSLMNTGTPETNFGFWFPGEGKDGAAGWQFMSSKVGSAWMGSSYPGGVEVPRGPWYYDGEIDLGFGGALRMARTLVTEDPLFGWIAYGGSWTEDADALQVVPRDGLRQRLAVVLADPRAPSLRARRLEVELARDGFAREQPLRVRKDLDTLTMTVENRTGNRHRTEIRLWLPYGAEYLLRQDGTPVDLLPTGDWDYPWRGTAPPPPSSCSERGQTRSTHDHLPTFGHQARPGGRSRSLPGSLADPRGGSDSSIRDPFHGPGDGHGGGRAGTRPSSAPHRRSPHRRPTETRPGPGPPVSPGAGAGPDVGVLPGTGGAVAEGRTLRRVGRPRAKPHRSHRRPLPLGGESHVCRDRGRAVQGEGRLSGPGAGGGPGRPRGRLPLGPGGGAGVLR